MNKQTKNILTIGFVIVLLIIVSAITYNNNLNNKNKIINQNTNINFTNMYDQNINNQEEQTVFRTATLHTTLGDVVFEFSEDKPVTTSNFIKLAKQRFYDGVKFHRVINGFMIQTGDPLSKDESQKIFWGTGGPGYKFDDELTGTETYEVGTVAMANSGPNTNGSQFFIMTSSTPLPPAYTVFGKVVEGQDVAQKIQEVETDSKDRPLENIIINSVELN